MSVWLESEERLGRELEVIWSYPSDISIVAIIHWKKRELVPFLDTNKYQDETDFCMSTP